jgi:hypothetical protein
MKTFNKILVFGSLAIVFAACSAKNPSTLSTKSISVPIGDGGSNGAAAAPSAPEIVDTTPTTVAPVVNPVYPQVSCSQNPPVEVVRKDAVVAANSGWGEMHNVYKQHGVYTGLSELLADIHSRDDDANVCVVDVYTTFGKFTYSITGCFSPMPPSMQVNITKTNFCCVDGFWSLNCPQ